MNEVELYANELYHYGIKGQKWGVRRYQYSDGTKTPAGRKRYANVKNMNSTQRSIRNMSNKISETTDSIKALATGKQYVDGYVLKGTELSRIQTSKDFEDHAFYATYKKQDTDKYMGLFGKNLKSRAAAEARRAERVADETGNENDIENAKKAREYSDNLRVYQLKITSTNKLKIPSDRNASDITANLLKEKEFRENVEWSIEDSKAKMRRPTQQMLFEQAQNALKKPPGKMSYNEKVAVYKALNLSLTNHDAREIAAQSRFYSELKKKGYNALLDYNDKEYSSYHAKKPIIVFDTNSVILSSVIETDPRIVNKLNAKYNAERARKEITANTIGYVTKLGNKTVSECISRICNS